METSSEFPEQSRRNSDEEILQASNNVEDRLRSAQEQLAELQLLTRADLHASPTPSLSTSVEITTPSLAMIDVADEARLDEDESHGRSRVGTGGLSSFTAILATSRKMATSSMDNFGQSDAPLEQTREPLTVQIPGRCPSSPKSPGKSLPTLNEEVEGEEDEDSEDEAPEAASITTTTTLTDTVSSSSDAVSVKQKQEPEEVDSDEFEFVEMLEHLSRGKIEFLALTAGDLTVRKLKRVHAALSRAQSSTPTMPYVRALVSIDMLRLLLQRLGARAVRDAITRAMQQVDEREELAADVDPIALLTSSNIAAVLLVARHELEAQANADSAPQLPRRTTVPAGRQALHSSPKFRSSSSPCSSLSSSPRCGTPRSPAASRRSILAKEGVHVLMQEKLVSFDHRGQTNALPAFRVRGDSAAITDSAAKRRQRGLQYANEHATQRTINL
ncbi:hypothetical protein PF008_g20005 [Phytophthora fragariae]|uniref:Uncharacterized protein n=1 Tax=Phytophthora fragariae TaxID=53985 RepID=A0A6G0R0R4_9STRA|nr:hypothetical protein PF008_g20005 [Phytophthora fragariae]